MITDQKLAALINFELNRNNAMRKVRSTAIKEAVAHDLLDNKGDIKPHFNKLLRALACLRDGGFSGDEVINLAQPLYNAFRP